MKNRIISFMTAVFMLFTTGIVLPVQADETEKVNLITNGGFTEGLEGWTNAADGGVVDATISDDTTYIHGNGKALTSKASAGGNAATTVRRYVEAEQGKTYKLSFYVYNTGAATKTNECMSAYVPVKLTGDGFGAFDNIDITFKDYTKYGGQNSWSDNAKSENNVKRADIVYQPGMNHSEYTITVPEDANYIMISLLAWTPVGRLYFSDFELYEVDTSEPGNPDNPEIPDSGNLITNGDFTNGCTDWTNAANGGVFDGTVSDNAAYIHGDGKALTNKVSAGGSAASTLRRFVPVRSGKTYYLSFWVYNTGAATGINECMSAFVPVKGKAFGTFDGVQFKDYVEYGGQNSWSHEKQSEVDRTRADIVYNPGMTHMEYLITVPTGAEYIMISMFAWTPVGRLYFSDFELYETDESTPTKTENVVRLNPAEESPFNNGEFQGWGTSLCWWANRIGASETMTAQAAELFFDNEKGLGLDIARFNIGGGDDPAHTHITRSDSNMPGYAAGFDGEGNLIYNWDADANQKNIAKAALEANPDIYFAGFSNSPPYFMTNSGCSSGAADPAKNNLKDDQYTNFAKYLAEVTKHLKEIGIDIQCMDPMNEPDTNYWGANSNKQEGCHFDPGTSQSTILVETRKALDAAGLTDVSVVGTDETAINKATNNFNSLSTEAKNAIDRIDTHTYTDGDRVRLKETAAGAGKNLWMSEVDGNWDMFGLANQILTDIHGMQPTAWIIWNIVDRHQDSNSDAYSVSSNGTRYEEKNMPFDPDGAIYGVGLGNWDKGEIELMQKYYGFGQFTRYIKPGMTIIGSSADTLAAYDKKTGEIAIVAVNSSAQEKTTKFDLRSLANVGEKVKVIRTSGTFNNGEQWAELEDINVVDKQFDAALKERSITTYVIEGNSREYTEATAIVEFTADENGMSYRYTITADMDEYNKYLAVYDNSGALRYVSLNEKSGTADGDFTGCTPKLMIWDDMESVLDEPITEVAPETENISYMTIEGATVIVTGQEYEYTAYVDSSEAPAKVTWSVSDSDIAEITTDGKLTAKKGGNLTITATTPGGNTTAIDITVVGLKK